jgi:tRNA(His) 5'-end guanylyltransferase
MSDNTALGNRMKSYEQITRYQLPRRTYAIIRVDGRAFHTLLATAERPFDAHVVTSMNAVAAALCAEIGGAVLAYTQSDECSVLVSDLSATGSDRQAWFGGVVQKMTSIAASAATLAFNEAYRRPEQSPPRAMFDARVFTINDPVEVVNYLIWRQRDCVRNSIMMAARVKFSHRQLLGKSSGQIQDLLWTTYGINWNDYPDEYKRGRLTVRRTAEREVEYVDRRTRQKTTTTALRSWWDTAAAPRFSCDPGEVLAKTIPVAPTLTRSTS